MAIGPWKRSACFCRAAWPDFAVRWLKVRPECFKQTQGIAACIFVAAWNMDVGLHYVAFRPGMNGNMRIPEQNRTGYAGRLKLEKCMSLHAQLQFIANAQAKFFEGVGMAQIIDGMPAIAPFGLEMEGHVAQTGRTGMGGGVICS